MGSGFDSPEIFDYTLTLTGAGCSALHATTLVYVGSTTELIVGPDSLSSCTGDIYATLNYKNQGALAPVKIASLRNPCGVTSVNPGTQTYCPGANKYLSLSGTGFASTQIFDYTVTLNGAGCSALHATTLVSWTSDTQLTVGPDSLEGCTGDIYVTLNYKNQGALPPVKIASLSPTCPAA